jgi:protein TonB
VEPAPERGLVNSYEKSLSELIRRHEKYPDRARRQGWQGTAVVGLSLSADGKVTDISIIESSGRNILDEAALTMVRRASPLPRAPEGLRGKERTVRVPIVFKLQDS